VVPWFKTPTTPISLDDGLLPAFKHAEAARVTGIVEHSKRRTQALKKSQGNRAVAEIPPSLWSTFRSRPNVDSPQIWAQILCRGCRQEQDEHRGRVENMPDKPSGGSFTMMIFRIGVSKIRLKGILVYRKKSFVTLQPSYTLWPGLRTALTRLPPPGKYLGHGHERKEIL
jgi:hypothetical protein